MSAKSNATEPAKNFSVEVLIGAQALVRTALDFWLRCVRKEEVEALLALEDEQFKGVLTRQVAEVVERRSTYMGQPARGGPSISTSSLFDFIYSQAFALLLPSELRQILTELGVVRITLKTLLPAVLPQPTFQEAKSLAIAVADGRSLRAWATIPGETALRYALPGEFDVKFMPSPYWEGQPNFYNLAHSNQDDVLAVLYLVGLAANEQGTVTLRLPELIRRFGWAPRSGEHRVQMLNRLWTDARLADSLYIFGTRPGSYKDPVTKKRIPLRSEDALIRIIGLRREKDAGGSGIPIEISFIGGPVVERFRGTSALQRIGDLLKIAAIPAGKPSGAWAKSLALALQQRWREQAAHVEVRRVGEDKHETFIFRPVTRHELLNTLPPQPWLDEVLAGPKPRRAVRYWNEALKLLRAKNIISAHNRDRLGRIPDRRPGSLKDWVNEPLDIRPGPALTAELASIRRAATKVRKQRRRK